MARPYSLDLRERTVARDAAGESGSICRGGFAGLTRVLGSARLARKRPRQNYLGSISANRYRVFRDADKTLREGEGPGRRSGEMAGVEIAWRGPEGRDIIRRSPV
jgi:hypothetical protein